jgi:putative membrane protein insertion efficiency factor
MRYRLLLKPWVGNACRFEPSCSAYALQALQRHGALGGSALTGWRILRCQPWCQGGCDPVPDTFRTLLPACSPGLDCATSAAAENTPKTRNLP